MLSERKLKLLCNQAIGGDSAAASELLREFYKPIFGYLCRLTGNRDDAADLTQITFAKAWNSLNRFRQASSFSTWIHRIAYCTHIDWVRQSKPTLQANDEWWRLIPATGPTPAHEAADIEDRRRLFSAVERLPDEDRQAIHLHYYQGLSLPQTAEVMAIPQSTLKYRLRNAVDRLRKDFPNTPAKDLNFARIL